MQYFFEVPCGGIYQNLLWIMFRFRALYLEMGVTTHALLDSDKGRGPIIGVMWVQYYWNPVEILSWLVFVTTNVLEVAL